MIRTQIQLTEAQSTKLRQLATQRRQSIAELIRQSIDRFLSSEINGNQEFQKRRERAILQPNLFRSEMSDIGRNHDKYLVEAFSDGRYREPDNSLECDLVGQE
jgi:hypothetical protein